MTGINQCLDLRIMRVTKKEHYNEELAAGGEEFRWGFLDPEQVRHLAQDPDNRIADGLVQTALARGDDCWGALDGDRLAFHCWYATEPTDDNGLQFHFSRRYKYAYSAAANPNYRGRQLYVISGNRVMREFHQRGFQGMVFSTDSHNLHAMRAATAFGADEVGYVVALKIGQRAWIHNSRGCRQHGVYLSRPTAGCPTAVVASSEEP